MSNKRIIVEALGQSTLEGCSKSYIFVKEAGYVARLVNVVNAQEMAACQRLRYDYFVDKKGWVSGNRSQLGYETDRYDSYAQHLAVFKDDKVMAYLRLLEWQSEVGFMLDTEFSCLVAPAHNNQTDNREGTAELSRLVINPILCLRSCAGDYRRVTEMLFKLFYHTALQRQLRGFYIEVEAAWSETFAHWFGLRFEPLGSPYTFPDGTITIAAYATLSQLETSIGEYSPAKLRWYQQLNFTDNPEAMG